MSQDRSSNQRGVVPPGTQLGDMYEIDSLLATGGMGEVYKGHELQTGDPVAIKLIKPEMAENEAALALFRKEASALRQLHHEAIVRYFGFAFDKELQRLYLAMELVEGASLSDLVRRGPLGVEDVHVLAGRVAQGLQKAHERGIVHRDVSPDNIIIPEGGIGQARIIDFGIARSTRGGDGTVIGGGFAGKYNYVSPEQLGLFGGDVTGKSDIYSLALVLAQALRGSPIDMGGSQFEVLDKRRRVPDLAGIDARMRPLLERMLAPDPAGRPAAMADVAAWPLATPGRREKTKPPAPVPAKITAHAAAAKPLREESDSVRGIVAPIVAVAVLAAGGFALWLNFGPHPDAKAVKPPPDMSLGQPKPQSGLLIPDAPVKTADAFLREPPAGEQPAAPQQEPVRPTIDAEAIVNTLRPVAGPAQIEPEIKIAAAEPPPPAREPEPPAAKPPEPPRFAVAPPVEKPVEKPVAKPVAKPDKPAVHARPQDKPQEKPKDKPAIVAAMEPPKIEGSRLDPAETTARLIRDYDGGNCFLALPRLTTAKTAEVEGFGSEVALFSKFDAALTAKGVDAQIDVRQIQPGQCAAIHFINQLKPAPADVPKIDITRERVQSGQNLEGAIQTAMPHVKLLIVDEEGNVADATALLKQSGERYTFKIPMVLEHPATNGPQPELLLAVASPLPVPALKTLGEIKADKLFPGLLADVKKLPGPSGVAARYFKVE